MNQTVPHINLWVALNLDYLCPGIAIHLPRWEVGEEGWRPKCWTWVCSHFKSHSLQETKFQLVRISRYNLCVLVPFILEFAWSIWRMGLFFPHSLSFEAVQRAHHYFSLPFRLIFGPRTFTLNSQFTFSAVAHQRGCLLRSFSASLLMPLVLEAVLSGVLKAILLLFQQATVPLTSLCSYLVTCCQLLSAHNQLRWILSQWAT